MIIEWLISLLLVLPAIGMAITRSNVLLDYAIVLLAFNRAIRRLVDYYCNGHFNPFSTISLTPLIVAGLMIIPVASGFGRLRGDCRRPFQLLAGALVVGFCIGLVRNRFAAVYSLGEWLAGVSAMGFAATQLVNQRIADRWIRTAGWCGVAVAAYGWWQYYTIPPWDGMWLTQSGMIGYMGLPEPTKMTVFSTLNERGPCGSFLAWAVFPMIIERRWRNCLGWFSVALLVSGIALTQTRSNLIAVAVLSVLHPALSRGRSGGRVLLLAVLIVGGATWGVERMPGLVKMKCRFEAEELYGKRSSLMGRLSIYESGLRLVLINPIGWGLGCSGMGQRAEGLGVNGEREAIAAVGDAGYVQVVTQLGWLGAGLFFASLGAVWSISTRRWRISEWLPASQREIAIPAARTVLLGSLVLLFVCDIFAGFSLLWVFLGRALCPLVDPVLKLRWWQDRSGNTDQRASNVRFLSMGSQDQRGIKGIKDRAVQQGATLLTVDQAN